MHLVTPLIFYTFGFSKAFIQLPLIAIWRLGMSHQIICILNWETYILSLAKAGRKRMRKYQWSAMQMWHEGRWWIRRSLAGAQRDQVHQGLNTHQHLHHMVLQRFRSAGFTGLQTNSQRWGDTADGDCQLSDPNWFAIPSAEFWLLGLYQAFNWMQETL